MLDAKLAQKLAGLAHEPLFQVFLDITNAYDSPNLTLPLKSYWEGKRIAPNTGKFLGKEFRTGRGLMQGDPYSPMILNILLDVLVREVLDVVCGHQEAEHSLVWAV